MAQGLKMPNHMAEDLPVIKGSLWYAGDRRKGSISRKKSFGSANNRKSYTKNTF